MSLERYLEEGVKFCALGVDIDLSEDIYPSCFPNGCEIAQRPFFELPDPWLEWIGSIKYKEIVGSNLIIIKRVRSDQPTILDAEAREIQKMINRMYVGLMLVSPFALRRRPVMLTGGFENSMVSLRSQGDLDPPVASLVHMYPPLTLQDFKNAAEVEFAIREKFEPIAVAQKWIFSRYFEIYINARLSSDIFDRIHQFSRAIEGLLDSEPGRTKQRFKGRTELFLGSGYHDLMGEIYDIRSSVEHVRAHRYLDIANRESRLRLAEIEAVSEYIARNVLKRIIMNGDLHKYFFFGENISEFWRLSDVVRSRVWGFKIDPLDAIRGFDHSVVGDNELGLE